MLSGELSCHAVFAVTATWRLLTMNQLKRETKMIGSASRADNLAAVITLSSANKRWLASGGRTAFAPFCFAKRWRTIPLAGCITVVLAHEQQPAHSYRLLSLITIFKLGQKTICVVASSQLELENRIAYSSSWCIQSTYTSAAAAAKTTIPLPYGEYVACKL